MSTVETPKPWTSAERASGGELSEEQPSDLETRDGLQPVTTEFHITSVRWGQTVNIGNYESVRLDVEAAVPTGGDPASTLTKLQVWSSRYLPMDQAAQRRAYTTRTRQEEELVELEERLAAMRKAWQRAVSSVTILIISRASATLRTRVRCTFKQGDLQTR